MHVVHVVTRVHIVAGARPNQLVRFAVLAAVMPNLHITG
jgi:hypothetical protein